MDDRDASDALGDVAAGPRASQPLPMFLARATGAGRTRSRAPSPCSLTAIEKFHTPANFN